MAKIDLKKLFPYSADEDRVNAITHGIGVLIAYLGLIYLIYVASTKGGLTEIIAFAIFGTTMLFMFLSSTLYHAMTLEKSRAVFKKLDHSAIFIFILGTYVPYVFSALKSELVYWIFAAMLAVGFFGILIKIFFSGRFKLIMTGVYLMMGWSAVLAFPIFKSELSSEALFYLMLGGAFYSIGAIIYALAKFKYAHSLWHLFVMAGAFSHYVSIAFYLL